MIVCCRLFLCLNLMPPGVSGVLLEIVLSCDTCCIYLSLCVLANKGVRYLKEVHSTSHCLNPILPSEPAEMQFGADSGGRMRPCIRWGVHIGATWRILLNQSMPGGHAAQ